MPVSARNRSGKGKMIRRIELTQAKGRTSKERIVLAERVDSNPRYTF